MKRGLLIAALAAGLALPALATELRLATWNLGWHMDMALARTWMAQCGRPFALSAKDQRWAPAAEGPAARCSNPRQCSAQGRRMVRVLVHPEQFCIISNQFRSARNTTLTIVTVVI